ncbi:MAG: Rrf2 family transcriptional regulator [Actinobacteria bacterium]|jgi:Rrf2 family protein|nr:Rrf2 family transcriptional regulator [Actinomycetota bacterium]
MKLVPTRRTDYGIRAMVYLAEQDGARTKASDIAGAMDIPQGFLHQVLRELQRSRLLDSLPSRNGGYALARPAEAITILQIVEALEGPLDDACALLGGPCHWEEVCALHWVWSSAREALAGELASATLAQVAGDDLALAQGKRPVPADSHRRAVPKPAAKPTANAKTAANAKPAARAKPHTSAGTLSRRPSARSGPPRRAQP